MGERLIISDNREDPGNPLAIGKIMVDQVWAEGTDPTGGGLYYERNSNKHRRLQVFETGSEDFMTGGWVRVLATAEQVRKERPGMERAAGGVPGRSLGLSNRRRAPVGGGRPPLRDRCGGGQAWQLSRGCGGGAASSR
jgi:hypothetical protein